MCVGTLPTKNENEHFYYRYSPNIGGAKYFSPREFESAVESEVKSEAESRVSGGGRSASRVRLGEPSPTGKKFWEKNIRGAIAPQIFFDTIGRTGATVEQVRRSKMNFLGICFF